MGVVQSSALFYRSENFLANSATPSIFVHRSVTGETHGVAQQSCILA